jgi:hypothetical protein
MQRCLPAVAALCKGTGEILGGKPQANVCAGGEPGRARQTSAAPVVPTREP